MRQYKMIKNKKAQEEMIGFALIMIVVAAILLVFLSLALRNSEKEPVESYEISGFIQAILQYSTNCEDSYGKVDVKEVIFMCDAGDYCANNANSCAILDSTLNNIVQESWVVSETSPVKGYELHVYASNAELLSIEQGNITNNYKGASQDFIKRGSNIEISFKAYY